MKSAVPGLFQFTQKLFLRDGPRMLVLRDAESGHGDLPGGRVSAEELYLLETSLLRELAEELGESVKVEVADRPFIVFPITALDGVTGIIAVAYEARLLSGEPRLSSEHDLMEWVDVSSYDPTRHYERSGLLGAVRSYLEYVRKQP